jgi:hypothetical protein
LCNESIDESTFQFNPFDIAPEFDNDEEPQFRPFLEQEIPPFDKFRPSQEIIGDVSPENILTHRRRGAEQYGAKTEEGSNLTYKQAINSLEKPDWEKAIVKEVNNMKD